MRPWCHSPKLCFCGYPRTWGYFRECLSGAFRKCVESAWRVAQYVPDALRAIRPNSTSHLNCQSEKCILISLGHARTQTHLKLQHWMPDFYMPIVGCRMCPLNSVKQVSEGEQGASTGPKERRNLNLHNIIDSKTDK